MFFKKIVQTVVINDSPGAQVVVVENESPDRPLAGNGKGSPHSDCQVSEGEGQVMSPEAISCFGLRTGG